LAFGAALFALPVSIAAAIPDGNGTDGTSVTEGQTGEGNPSYDPYTDDTSVTPSPFGDDNYDPRPGDEEGGDDLTIPCSQYDPCGLNEL
jgi:hypothetical protein